MLAALPVWREAGLMVIHVTGRYKGPDYDAVAETEAALAEMGIEGDWYRRLDYADQIGRFDRRGPIWSFAGRVRGLSPRWRSVGRRR